MQSASAIMRKLGFPLLASAIFLCASCALDTDEDFDPEACRTDCEDVHTACIIDCDGDATCRADCDQALDVCVDRCL